MSQFDKQNATDGFQNGVNQAENGAQDAVNTGQEGVSNASEAVTSDLPQTAQEGREDAQESFSGSDEREDNRPFAETGSEDAPDSTKSEADDLLSGKSEGEDGDSRDLR